MDFGYEDMERPILGLFHYDFLQKRTREDHYYIEDDADTAVRFMTSINHFDEVRMRSSI